MKGILLGDDGDLKAINGKIDFGDTLTQEVSLLLTLNQGELKSDPILGPGLVKLIRSGASPSKLQALVRTHLARDGKNLDDIKDMVTFNTKMQ